VFDLPKYGDGVCSRGWPNCWMRLAIDRGMAAASFGGGDRPNGRAARPQCAPRSAAPMAWADRPLHLAHLLRFNERIRIDNDEIEIRGFARLKHGSRPPFSDFGKARRAVGAFEALFALACLYFQESDCDFIVFEPGSAALRIRSAWSRARDLRHLGRLRACRSARRTLGADRIDKSDAVPPAAPSSMARMPTAAVDLSKYPIS